jgi:hypothetical protein
LLVAVHLPRKAVTVSLVALDFFALAKAYF